MSTKQAEKPSAETTEAPAEPKRYPSDWDKLVPRFPAAFAPSPDYGAPQFGIVGAWDAKRLADREEEEKATTADLDDHYERALGQVHSGTKVTVAEVPVHHETS